MLRIAVVAFVLGTWVSFAAGFSSSAPIACNSRSSQPHLRHRPRFVLAMAGGGEDSLVQKVSRVSQIGPFAALKQFIAESVAGDYDAKKIAARIDETIDGSPVAMFSFTTCPFCVKAKDVLANELGVKPENIKIIECDQDPEGNAIRAVLGKKTGRTSMPSVWIKGAGYVGGCNDGGLGGVVPLNQQGKLKGMLQAAGALD